jgi:hypothetical protein
MSTITLDVIPGTRNTSEQDVEEHNVEVSSTLRPCFRRPFGHHALQLVEEPFGKPLSTYFILAESALTAATGYRPHRTSPLMER